MNKKGFTTIEMILTIVLVIIIMASITSVTYTYRDRATYEETITDLTNYKNTLTKIIYDDILYPEDSAVVSISRGLATGDLNENDYTNIRLEKLNGTKIGLSIINETGRVGIRYNNVDYIIPDSESDLIVISDIELKRSRLHGIYSVDITYFHKNIPDYDFKIHFALS